MKIKVCGLREPDNIRAVSELGVDYIGMIFWPQSSRYVSMVPTYAGIIPDRASYGPSRPPHGGENGPGDASHTLMGGTGRAFVGVFVDDMAQNIVTRVVNYGLGVVQLHGHETPTLIRNLRRTLDPDIRPGVQIWKAISVAPNATAADITAATEPYMDCVDLFLFDTKSALPGGSGQQYDWTALDAYDGPVPFMLSGGIGPDDTDRVRAFSHPRCVGVDLNSRFETAPAVKDVDLLRQFVDRLRTP